MDKIELNRLVKRLQGIKGVNSANLVNEDSYPQIKAHLNNLYTISLLIHPEDSEAIFFQRNIELAVLSPQGNLIELEDDTIKMCTEIETYSFVEEISGKQMAHISDSNLAQIVRELKESPLDAQASFSASMRYTRLLGSSKSALIRGAMQYHLEFETIQDLKGLIFSELFFKVSGRSEDLLRFIYALDTWIDD